MPNFKKGSTEAKKFMAKLRAKRSIGGWTKGQTQMIEVNESEKINKKNVRVKRKKDGVFNQFTVIPKRKQLELMGLSGKRENRSDKGKLLGITVKAHTRLIAGLNGYYPPGTTTKTMQKVYALSSFNGLRIGSNVTILSKDEFNGLKGRVSNISTFQTNIDNPDIFINVKWGTGYRLTKRKAASLIF